MLGRLLGHNPGLWQQVAQPILRSTRAAGSKARNTQDMALQMADPGKEAFRNERRPTNFDKKVLVWSGCFKKEEDIPRHILYEVLNTARNIVRIKVCYIMIALTVLGCVTMTIIGKEAAKKDLVLLRVNTEKKAKWRAEVKKGQEAAVGIIVMKVI
ncbi:protein FAM162A-like [Cinclus cinclus]|uniref:protein FAM162A-like n=1 Tax=Cinclus cinclus TaxID=127875 RepID=UPI002E15290F